MVRSILLVVAIRSFALASAVQFGPGWRFYRAGWAATRPQARQFVGHGHISVNGKRVTIPSYRVRKGEVVTIRDKAREMIVVQWNRDVLDRRPPAWLESGDDNFQVTVLQPPVRDQIDVPVREQLIVELYSK